MPPKAGALRPEASEIAPALLDWLRHELGVPDLIWSEPPALLADGVTARVFSLRLAGVEENLARPLVCRVYCDGFEDLPADQVEVEAALQTGLVSAGFPAPRVVSRGDASSPIGAPFIVMERAPGFDALSILSLALAAGVALRIAGFGWPLVLVLLGFWLMMARLLRRLHAVPGDAISMALSDAGVSLERLGVGRILKELGRTVHEQGEAGAIRVHDWLLAQCPAQDEMPTICHGDFWLGNVMLSTRGVALIDWTQAALAHRELDLGWMSVQHYSRLPLPIRDPLFDWLWLPVRPLTWLLLAPPRLMYRWMGGVDVERLHYYAVLWALKLLVETHQAGQAWAEACGRRPSLLSAWGSRHTRLLLRWRIRRITGLDPRP